MQNKCVETSSEAILREQKQILREQFFSNRALVIGLVIFSAIVLSAVFIPMVTGVDPNAMDVVNRLKPPSAAHIFGTDEFGRDLFTRILYGARSSLAVGCSVALLSCFFGTVIGIYASYFKAADAVLMRICEGLTAIPGILLAIALMAALGASNTNVIIALTIVYTPSVARVVRSNALVARGQLYVEAARVQGASAGRILWKLILPNVISPLTVQASYIFAQAILRLREYDSAVTYEGEILFEGRDILKLSQKEMRALRGNRIAVIFQDPMTSLNPVSGASEAGGHRQRAGLL